jgi:hypothetical protein
MDNLATIEPSSTTLDPGAVSPTAAGGGAPTNEPPSLRDSIEAAVKEVSQPEDKAPANEADKDAEAAKADAKVEKGQEKPKDEKAEEKPKEPAKTERAPDGKFAAKAQEEKPAEAAARQIEQSIKSAPAKFMPDAKEKWAHTPRAVQREVETMIAASERREQEHRETSERYSRLRDFDELARSNGRDLRESLERVKAFEDTMRASPITALNMALMEVGPRKNDGQPYSLYEVAQFIVGQGPEGYQRLVQQQQPQQQQEDPRIGQLQRQLQEVQAQTIADNVIAPFKASHPRYEELQDDIAFFLKSGKIDPNLSHLDRLEVAYDMAERINPSPHASAYEDKDGLEPEGDRVERNLSGSKSIKSAPGSITPDEEPERGGSIREQLERAIRNQRRA